MSETWATPGHRYRMVFGEAAIRYDCGNEVMKCTNNPNQSCQQEVEIMRSSRKGRRKHRST
jgi:hypothetical protein